MRVTALDRDPDQQPDAAGLTKIAADLEAGSPWPLAGQRFDLVVVTNYLHRPILPEIVGAVPGGRPEDCRPRTLRGCAGT